MPDPRTEPFLSAARVAAILDVTRDAVYDMVDRGEWPAIHIGRILRIPTAAWMKAVGLTAEADQP